MSFSLDSMQLSEKNRVDELSATAWKNKAYSFLKKKFFLNQGKNSQGQGYSYGDI